ncbi:hypothetical protein LTR78_004148 [Recurvomyces mirabilis]|uniref:DUF1772-domain-containing protein n=1 Tax=Recurvomyces mirabilis TaxID=574656 RepID=A0AAE1C2R6_9PEZI|nr:hypothetical protein LTR78_004148 [Recurvomyces mirabilis]KAK5153681.1 hypothetical protein LTS14_007375 [Recurvomyces mirabilis]
MASAFLLSGPLWFFTPIQIVTTVIAGMNCGASSLQSPLTWPLLQDVDVPVHYVGRQTEHLLHGSEIIFPPFNGVCTIANLVLTGIAYYKRNDDLLTSAVADAKLPWTAIAFGMHVATTVFTLTIMAPYNQKLKVASKQLNEGIANKEGKESTSQQQAEKDFREAQKVWKVRNYGRGAIMLAAAIANAIALKI